MSSEGEGPAVGPRLHRLFTLFDPEAAAVMSILFGIFQILLSAPLYYCDVYLPKFFLLPLAIGVLIVTAGSFSVASEKFPSRHLLQGCAYSNVVSLLGALLAFCFYCVSLSTVKKEPCNIPNSSRTGYNRGSCPHEHLKEFFGYIAVLLVLYDVGAVVLHCLLSVSALKALRNN